MSDEPSYSDSFTPRHYPIFNVKLDLTELRAIIETALPDAEFLSGEEFPRGSSFNNRLYAVNVRLTEVHKSRPCAMILKVCGRSKDWKHRKVINEVFCLRIIKEYCPELPVPQVYAWCNGLETVTERGILDLTQASTGPELEWILMTRVPGVRVAGAKLNERERLALTEQVAAALASLRTNIPRTGLIGNLERVSAAYTHVVPLDEADITIGGLINQPASGGPWSSLLEYYRATIRHEVHLLGRYRELVPVNDQLIRQVECFIETKLHQLPIFHDHSVPVSIFTHGDLADRNLLFSRGNEDFAQVGVDTRPPSLHERETPVRFTGWVDWEFAGFYNPFEEYLLLEDEEEFIGRILPCELTPCAENATVASQEPESKRGSLATFYALLERLGVPSPTNRTSTSGYIQRHWDVARHLYQIQCNIIPWYVRAKLDAGSSDAVLEEFQAASYRVESSLNWLIQNIY